MAEAIAKAAGVPGAEVRRAMMLRGALGPVAEAALAAGVPPCASSTSRSAAPSSRCWPRPRPASRRPWSGWGEAAVEWKLDGVRVQLHQDGDEVRVFTRTLDDVTARVPEVVEIVMALPVRSAVLDGEVIALHPDGRPQPFQVTAGRLRQPTRCRGQRLAVPLTLYLFDVLHVDGDDLIDRAGVERHAVLAAIAPEALRVPRTVTSDPLVATGSWATPLPEVTRACWSRPLAAPYEAGRRGAGWLKVKPVHTLDLVVLAVEWGHGRRRGWLSNLHLGARDPEAGGFVMLGKTFKGLTDKLLAWQTERLLELADGPTDQWVVRVRPELVVEVAFDGVQASPRYPGGVALRFARVLRYRPDKRADDADTIETVRAIHGGAPPRTQDAAGGAGGPPP